MNRITRCAGLLSAFVAIGTIAPTLGTPAQATPTGPAVCGTPTVEVSVDPGTGTITTTISADCGLFQVSYREDISAEAGVSCTPDAPTTSVDPITGALSAGTSEKCTGDGSVTAAVKLALTVGGQTLSARSESTVTVHTTITGSLRAGA